MTYLELVNGVLSRLREDTISTVAGNSDVVVNIVRDLVNDAKRLCEDAHTWNGLRDEWTINTAAGTATYPLTDAGQYAKIESIYGSGGRELREVPLADIRRKAASGVADSTPVNYAVDGQNASKDILVRLGPTPDAVEVLTVYGYKHQADLALDTDELLIPAKPVLYWALALAARERGEVNGQTAGELASMAKEYLSNAIAYDASMNDYDNIWMTV